MVASSRPALRSASRAVVRAVPLALLAAALGLADDAGAAPRRTRGAQVADQLLAALVEANGVPGMGAAVWQDGKVVWTGSAGYRDLARKRPVDRDTRFRLASVSKLLTVTAAALLEQEGTLDLDASVATMLPQLPAQWAPVTARQLAAHTAGAPHYEQEPAPPQERAGSAPPTAGKGGPRYRTAAAALGVFQDYPLRSAPGARYAYSSWGYTLLSAVVERQASVPFLDFLARRVTPGLAIGADASASGRPEASKVYELVDGQAREAVPNDCSYTWGGGCLGGTPRALVELAGRLMSGELLSRQAFERMLAPATLPDGQLVRDEDYAVGFGWRTGLDRDGQRIAHHAGVTLGARSALVLWPERGAAVSLLSNALWVSSIEQSAQMLAAPFAPEPAGLVAAACPAGAVRYHGRFGDQPIAGAVRFTVQGGTCAGELELEAGGALAEYVNRPMQKDARQLRVIGLGAKGELGRAALVTPLGLYDLRATREGKHVAPLGKRELAISFAAAAAAP